MKLIVEKNGELLDYLYEHLDMPKKRVKQYLTHGSIYVNNNKTTKYNYPLIVGMNIMIDTDNNQAKSFPFEILFEDNHLLVINKPSGLPIFTKEKEKSLYQIVRNYLREKENNNHAFLIHSQDKDTSGIVVFAKNEKMKKKLLDNWQEYLTLQEYVVVVEGKMDREEDQIIEYLKKSKGNLYYRTKENEGIKAIIEYKVLKEKQNYSLLEIKAKTNVKDQVRVILNNTKHHILGDQKYGNKKDNYPRLLLHANRLKFYYPEIKKEILMETAIPKEIKLIVK